MSEEQASLMDELEAAWEEHENAEIPENAAVEPASEPEEIEPPEKGLTFPRCSRRAKRALFLVTLSAHALVRLSIVVLTMSDRFAKAMISSPIVSLLRA